MRKNSLTGRQKHLDLINRFIGRLESVYALLLNSHSLPKSQTEKMYKIVLITVLICLIGLNLEVSAAPAPIFTDFTEVGIAKPEAFEDRVERAAEAKTTSTYRPVCWGFAGVCG